MSLKLVWIEDEPRLLQECTEYLRRESIEVQGVHEFETARQIIERERPDLLLVDWMLPGGVSGLDICKWNEKHWRLPLIMVTAKGDEFDKVLALELGADDYLTKPFGLRELSARIKAVMRRVSKGKDAAAVDHDDVLHRGELVLDKLRFTTEYGGGRIELTRTEFLLLWKLASYPARAFSRMQLMDEALGDGFLGYERTLDSHIRNVRRKLEESGAGADLIQTVYGVGYRFAEGL